MEDRKYVMILQRSTSMRQVISVFFFIFCLMIATGCQGNQWILYHDKEINGAVVEAETGKPIEGAIVIAMWALTQVPGEGFGGYANVEVVKTNKEGKFTVPSWIAFKPWKIIDVVHDLAPKIIIYKPGYKLHFSHKIMREGYPDDYSKTSEQKKIAREKFGITPAKLNKIYTDQDRFENLSETEYEVDLSGYFYSKKQKTIITDAIKEELNNISDKFPRKIQYLKPFNR